MSFSPVFSVIIPVHNRWKLTQECLLTLVDNTPPGIFEVIVADNGSTDETATHAAAFGESLFGERFRAIQFDMNRNFGPACNSAASVAVAPLLFFLNNDTRLLPDWVPPLLTEFADSGAMGAVCPLLLYPDERVQHLGVAFGTASTDHLYRNFPARHPAIGKRRTLRAITAAAMMLPRELFFEAGAFFEEYRNGFEDLELCTRLRQLGKSLTCLPESRIVHLESRTSGRYDAENANAALFHSRLGNTVVPDRHIHGVKDGFAPFITDSLDIGLRLPPAEENDLVGQMEGKSLDHWALLAEEHPFWIRGREIIAHTLERAGHWEQALGWRIDIASVLDSVQAWSMLGHCAAMAGENRIRSWSEERKAAMPSVADAEQAARRFIRLADRRGDRLLVGLFEKKLQLLTGK